MQMYFINYYHNYYSYSWGEMNDNETFLFLLPFQVAKIIILIIL